MQSGEGQEGTGCAIDNTCQPWVEKTGRSDITLTAHSTTTAEGWGIDYVCNGPDLTMHRQLSS